MIHLQNSKLLLLENLLKIYHSLSQIWKVHRNFSRQVCFNLNTIFARSKFYKHEFCHVTGCANPIFVVICGPKQPLQNCLSKASFMLFMFFESNEWPKLAYLLLPHAQTIFPPVDNTYRSRERLSRLSGLWRNHSMHVKNNNDAK